jgi:hypothetical protein
MKEKSDKKARKEFKANILDDAIFKLDSGLDHIKEVVRPSTIASRRTKSPNDSEVSQPPTEDSQPVSREVSKRNLKRSSKLVAQEEVEKSTRFLKLKAIIDKNIGVHNTLK